MIRKIAAQVAYFNARIQRIVRDFLAAQTTDFIIGNLRSQSVELVRNFVERLGGTSLKVRHALARHLPFLDDLNDMLDEIGNDTDEITKGYQIIESLASNTNSIVEQDVNELNTQFKILESMVRQAFTGLEELDEYQLVETFNDTAKIESFEGRVHDGVYSLEIDQYINLLSKYANRIQVFGNGLTGNTKEVKPSNTVNLDLLGDAQQIAESWGEDNMTITQSADLVLWGESDPHNDPMALVDSSHETIFEYEKVDVDRLIRVKPSSLVVQKIDLPSGMGEIKAFNVERAGPNEPSVGYGTLDFTGNRDPETGDPIPQDSQGNPLGYGWIATDGTMWIGPPYTSIVRDVNNRQVSTTAFPEFETIKQLRRPAAALVEVPKDELPNYSLIDGAEEPDWLGRYKEMKGSLFRIDDAPPLVVKTVIELSQPTEINNLFIDLHALDRDGYSLPWIERVRAINSRGEVTDLSDGPIDLHKQIRSGVPSLVELTFQPVQAIKIEVVFSQPKSYETSIAHPFIVVTKTVEYTVIKDKGGDITNLWNSSHKEFPQGTLTSSVRLPTDPISPGAVVPLNTLAYASSKDGETIVSGRNLNLLGIQLLAQTTQTLRENVLDQRVEYGLEQFDGNRWAVAIKEIGAGAVVYKPSAVCVTKSYDVRRKIRMLELHADEVADDPSNIRYSFSFDGNSWFGIEPLDRSSSGEESDLPTRYYVNRWDVDGQTIELDDDPTRVQVRIELDRGPIESFTPVVREIRLRILAE